LPPARRPARTLRMCLECSSLPPAGEPAPRECCMREPERKAPGRPASSAPHADERVVRRRVCRAALCVCAATVIGDAVGFSVGTALPQLRRHRQARVHVRSERCAVRSGRAASLPCTRGRESPRICPAEPCAVPAEPCAGLHACAWWWALADGGESCPVRARRCSPWHRPMVGRRV